MAEYQLTAEPPLSGYDRVFGPVRVSAPKGLSLVSIALPRGAEAAAHAAIKSGFGTDLPAAGHYAIGNDGQKLIRTSPDQALVLFESTGPAAERGVSRQLDNAVYATDQTDSWVILQVEGELVREVLERICPLDLHPGKFTTDMAQRTSMEHLGTLILRNGENSFLLMSASSSAQSFLHAIETSVKNLL